MSGVIKAVDTSRASRPVAFSFDDMSREAEQYVDKVRAQALQVVEEARREADKIRRKAEEEGRQAAQRDIDKLVDQQVAQKLEVVLPAMRQLIAQLKQTEQAWLAHWEQTAVHVAALMAERVIRRKLTKTPEVTLDLVREALRLAAGSPELRVRLHPEDHAALSGQLSLLSAETSQVAPATFVADPSIERGGCRVESKFGVVDQQLTAQLARIEEELT